MIEILLTSNDGSRRAKTRDTMKVALEFVSNYYYTHPEVSVITLVVVPDERRAESEDANADYNMGAR